MKTRIGCTSPYYRPQQYARRDPYRHLPFAEEIVRPGCAVALAGLAVLVICILVALGVSA